MESNKTYHLLFKYVFLGAGLLIMAIPIISFFFPSSVKINGETGSTDPISTIIMGLLGLTLILVFFVIRNKFAIIELKNQTITIKQHGEERKVTWLDIESVSQIQFVQPPLYKLRIKDNDETIWFNTQPEYTSVNGFTSDHSEMGEIIKKKKRELGL